MPTADASISGREKAVIAILLYATLLTIWAPAAVVSALPQIQAHFADLPNADLLARLTLTMPALFIAATAPVAGWVMDKVGRKPVLLSAIALYVIVGPAGLYVQTLPQLLIARALLGIAIGGSMPTVITLIGDYFDGERRSKVMGFQSAALEFGAVLFTILAGVLASLSWRAPFSIFMLAIPLLPLVYVLIQEPDKARAAPPSGPGKAPAKSRLPATTIFAYLIGALGMTGIFLLPVHLPFLIARDLQLPNPFLISVAIGVSTLFAGISASYYHRIKRKLSTLSGFVPCFLLMSAGYAVFAISQAYWMVLVGAAFAGIGIGIFLPNINMWVVSMAPPPLRGRTVAGLMSFVFLGQFSSPLVSTAYSVRYGLDQLFLTASAIALIVAIAFGLSTRAQARHAADAGLADKPETD